MKINPLWTAYNNIHNEGGEGYNPHDQHIETGKGEPLWSKLDERAYRIQNAMNALSESDPIFADFTAELVEVKAALAIAIKENI